LARFGKFGHDSILVALHTVFFQRLKCGHKQKEKVLLLSTPLTSSCDYWMRLASVLLLLLKKVVTTPCAVPRDCIRPCKSENQI
jgi:hypothetical protein